MSATRKVNMIPKIDIGIATIIDFFNPFRSLTPLSFEKIGNKTELKDVIVMPELRSANAA